MTGFCVSKELERVYLSLMRVELVYREHPHPSHGMQNQCGVPAASVIFSNAMGSWIAFCYKTVLFKAVQLEKFKICNLPTK